MSLTKWQWGNALGWLGEGPLAFECIPATKVHDTL